MLGSENFYVKDNILLILQLTQPDYVISYSNELAKQILNLPNTNGIVYLKDYINHYLYLVLQKTCSLPLDTFPNYQFMHCFRLPNQNISLFINMYHFRICQVDYISIYGIPLDTHSFPFVNHFMLESKSPLYSDAFDGLFTLKLTSNAKLILLNYNSIFLTYLNLKTSSHLNGKTINSFLPSEISDFLYTIVTIALQQKKVMYQSFDFCPSTTEESDKSGTLLPIRRLIFSLFPLNNPDLQGVFCRVNEVSIQNTMVNQTPDLYEEYSHLFYLTSDAIAIYDYSNPSLPVLEKINSRMEQFLKHFSIKQDLFLIGKELWTLMLDYKKEVHQVISLTKDHMVYQFNLFLVPIVRNNKIIKVMLILYELNNVDKIDHKSQLTKREEEIICHVLKGEKNEYIANILNISTGTVKRTLSNAYKKLGINSRIELFYFYHQ